MARPRKEHRINSSWKRALMRASNRNKTEGGKPRSFVIDYKKLNGEATKRKIDPLEVKNNLVVAFDHKRNGLRSFKVERIKSMTKAAFWEGFEKESKKDSGVSWKDLAPAGAVLAGLGGLAALKGKGIARSARLGGHARKLKKEVPLTSKSLNLDKEKGNIFVKGLKGHA